MKSRQSKSKKSQNHQPEPALTGSPVHRLLQLIAKSIVKKYEPDDTKRDYGKT
ncbi:hypothetical protein [Gimesia sp.]|uniref:hypothetical protein n=1 Tax=Gimesia sp. TaxID=2024833 RepID=UPI003A93FF5A